MAEIKAKKIDWLRLIATALLLCAVTFGLFYLHSGKVAEVIEALTAEEKYPNTIWLIEFTSSAVPILAAVILMNIMYSDKKSYVPVYTQIEKLVVSIVLVLFVFGALLGYVFYRSRGGEIVDAETGEAIKTLWDKTYMWFFAQILPLLILVSYHLIRIGSEKNELAEMATRAAEVEETVVEETVAEEEK